MNATYVLPVRLQSENQISELAPYLRALQGLEIVVVDGSPKELFEAFDREIGDFALHVPPSCPGANGKACGVMTGLALASHEKIVVADDDVRYDGASLRSVLRLLDDAAVVRPQNYFSPVSWHALLDSSRSLINRAFGGDWPGTLAFRRSTLPNGYNTDVLSENYELVRTVQARGGKELVAFDCYVARRPPSYRHFVSQRVRQAYDEFARPVRLLTALAILPSFCVASAAFGVAASTSVFIALSVAMAAVGWLRGGAYRYFSALAVLAAPVWVAERSICSWLALYERVRFGGARYGDAIIASAASSARERMRWSC